MHPYFYRERAIAGTHDGNSPDRLPKPARAGHNGDVMTGDFDPRRRRLLFRSQHRGTKETDLMLGGFAAQCLAGLSDAQLDRFEALLEAPDTDLFDWVSGRLPAPPPYNHDVMDLLIAFNAKRPA